MLNKEILNGPYYTDNGIMMPLYPFLTIMSTKYPGYNIYRLFEVFCHNGDRFETEESITDYLQNYDRTSIYKKQNLDEIYSVIKNAAANEESQNSKSVVLACQYIMAHMEECLPLIKRVKDCSWRYNLLHISMGENISYMKTKEWNISYSKNLLFNPIPSYMWTRRKSEISWTEEYVEKIMRGMIDDGIIWLWYPD